MRHPFDLTFILGRLTRLVGRRYCLKQKGVITFFDPQNVTQIMLPEFLHMRCIGAETIFGDNEGPLRVVLTQLGQKSLGCIPFTVVFGRPILFDDRFGYQS